MTVARAFAILFAIARLRTAAMGGAKRYLSITFRGGDGFREELNPSYGLTQDRLK
jgi:hypothetical protein